MARELLSAIPLTSLKGVGVKLSDKLAKIGILNVQDLLFHLPRKYEDRTKITSLHNIHLGEHCTIVGYVQSANIQFSRMKTMLVTLSDGTSKICLRFFNFNAAMHRSFAVGAKVRAFGEIKRGRFMAEMHHPEYQIIQENQPLTFSENLTPIYPTTEGLKQVMLNKLIDEALTILKNTDVEELLPCNFSPFPYRLVDALRVLHRPDPSISIEQLEQGEHEAQKRLVFEELLAHQLAMLNTRAKGKSYNADSLQKMTAIKEKFLSTLPFYPTDAQQRVVSEIEQDLMQNNPMMRLVQGDVGSGKTLVAAMAALRAIENNKQVCLMAPTEILGEQHFISFKNFFEPLGINVSFLAGKVKGKTKEKTLEKIASGESQMIVGTHALFQKDVIFNDLSLVIIDEQHRFGVEQRLSLIDKGKKVVSNHTIYPHQLVMTATPIPRTLAMTSYGDLDLSIIDELPPGRTPVGTVTISSHRRDEIIDRVGKACINEGRQAYWVCTLIEESEVLEAQAAQDIFEDLQKLLPNLTIGLVHGKMKASEKQEVMDNFKQGNIHLLVATTVIEVGVDVPNASLMIIENAERLGLSQLHQLRGRVGRGSAVSHCVLMYQEPIGKISRQRLAVMRDTNDGFKIAEEDLKIRGFGELLGTKQTGDVDFKVANLDRDQDMIPLVRQKAFELVKNYPHLIEPIIKRWIYTESDYENV